MKTNRWMSYGGLMLLALVIGSVSCNGQVVVDNKDVNNDSEIRYIQLAYYLDKKTMRPLYFIDYGLLEKDDAETKLQNIQINQDAITDRMSPMMVLNKLDKAGWEYLGDAQYIQMPMVDNWQAITLKRKTD